MAYVESGTAKPGQSVEVDIRSKREPATVVGLPFYKRR
jgi:glycine cleavage system aminomethyltransferase T